MIDSTPEKKPRAKRPKPVHHPEDFNLDILSGDDDMFRWFLLTYLLAKPIHPTVAVNTWKLFIDRKVDTPWGILAMPDRTLTMLLHSGGYTRYQHLMTHALKTSMQQLVSMYEGSIFIMLEDSADEAQLTKRLQTLYGVGPKTAEIFVREVEEYFARRIE
jgi:endonuclease III